MNEFVRYLEAKEGNFPKEPPSNSHSLALIKLTSSLVIYLFNKSKSQKASLSLSLPLSPLNRILSLLTDRELEIYSD